MEYVISKLDMNDMMSAILKNQKEKEISSQLDTILESIVNRTTKIKDCILYDGDGPLEEEKINFERIGYRKNWIYL